MAPSPEKFWLGNHIRIGKLLVINFLDNYLATNYKINSVKNE